MEEKEKPKKPYVKPEIKQIDLRPEEAVLGRCKMSTSAGPMRPTCTTYGGRCYTIGT